MEVEGREKVGGGLCSYSTPHFVILREMGIILTVPRYGSQLISTARTLANYRNSKTTSKVGGDYWTNRRPTPQDAIPTAMCPRCEQKTTLY